MTVRCKHGIDEMSCAWCREAAERAPLRPDALVATSDGNPALLLGPRTDSGYPLALVLDKTGGHLTNVVLASIRPLDSTTGWERPVLLAQFHAVALQMGYLAHPERALTYREQTEEGPARCYHCHIELSLEKRSLGCTQCQYYVCQCGRCLCGYTGMNYRGQVFSQLPALPIPRSERLAFVRVVRFCADSI